MNSSIIKQTKLKHLQKIEVLGEGQFGEVWHVQTKNMVYRSHQTNGTVVVKQTGIYDYALKIQQKQDDIRWEETEVAIKREIQALHDLTSEHYPFICDLVHTYEDESTIQILMKLITGGGELRHLLKGNKCDDNDPTTFDEGGPGITLEQTEFYTYIIADTLRYIHSKNYVYRDLKPENVMIDDYGHPILIDFGFAKKLPPKMLKLNDDTDDGCERELTYTFCGTPEYAAPEILNQVGHNHAVDYWALGALLYEMVTNGKEHPFYYDGLDTIELYNIICYEPYEPLQKDLLAKIPNSKDLLDLIDKLLMKDPSERLGTDLSQDVVTDHKWFKGTYNIKKIHSGNGIYSSAKRTIKAPWIPPNNNGGQQATASTTDMEMEETTTTATPTTTATATTMPNKNKSLRTRPTKNPSSLTTKKPCKERSLTKKTKNWSLTKTKNNSLTRPTRKSSMTLKKNKQPSTTTSPSKSPSPSSVVANDDDTNSNKENTSSPSKQTSATTSNSQKKVPKKTSSTCGKVTKSATSTTSSTTKTTTTSFPSSSPKVTTKKKIVSSSLPSTSPKQVKASTITKKTSDKGSSSTASPIKSTKMISTTKKTDDSSSLNCSTTKKEVKSTKSGDSNSTSTVKRERPVVEKLQKTKQRSVSAPPNEQRKRRSNKLVIPAAFQCANNKVEEPTTMSRSSMPNIYSYSYRKKAVMNKDDPPPPKTSSSARSIEQSSRVDSQEKKAVKKTLTKKEAQEPQQRQEEKPRSAPALVSNAVVRRRASCPEVKEETKVVKKPTTAATGDNQKESSSGDDEAATRRRSSKKIKIPSAFKRSKSTPPSFVGLEKPRPKTTATKKLAAEKKEVTAKAAATPTTKKTEKKVATTKKADPPKSAAAASTSTKKEEEEQQPIKKTHFGDFTKNMEYYPSLEYCNQHNMMKAKTKYTPSYASSQQLLNNSNHKRSEQQQQRMRRGNKLVIPAAFRARA